MTRSPALRPLGISTCVGVVEPDVDRPAVRLVVGADDHHERCRRLRATIASTGTASAFGRCSATISTCTGVPAASCVARGEGEPHVAVTPAGSTAAGRVSTAGLGLVAAGHEDAHGLSRPAMRREIGNRHRRDDLRAATDR